MLPRKRYPWSYSQWDMFTQCRRKWKFRYIEHLPITQHPAAERGERIHFACEQFLNHETNEHDAELSPYWRERVAELRDLGAKSETGFGVDDHWDASPYEDTDNTHARGKLDALVECAPAMRIIDFKTGKVRSNHREQLNLYALLYACNTRKTDLVGELWYFDTPEARAVITYNAEYLNTLHQQWQRRGKIISTATHFEASPGWYCRYCPYAKENGGPCNIRDEERHN